MTVDAQGRLCRAGEGALARDGRFLLPPGSPATLYLDEDGELVERDELRSVRAGEYGAPTGEPQAAEAAGLLSHTIRQAYALDPVAALEPLEVLLAETGICWLDEGDESGKAQFLVKKDAGCFLLVGEQAGFEGFGGRGVRGSHCLLLGLSGLLWGR